MKALVLFLGGCLTLSLINNSEAYQYVPPNRNIEVVDHDEYTFGLEEEFGDFPIIKCYYTTDTGIEDSFDVGLQSAKQVAQEEALLSPIEEEETREFYNVIKHLGDQGLCQITVSNVNETGPRVWNLTATAVDWDNNEHNGTGFVFTVTYFYRAKILEYLVEILEYTNFYNHLTLPSNLMLTSCKVKVGETEMDLNVRTPETPNVFISPYTVREDELTQRIESLGRGLCGLRVFNMTKEGIWPEKWTLTAIDEQGRKYREAFTTRVNIFSGIVHWTRSVVMGTEFSLQCGQAITQRFCTLFDPRNATVYTRDCKYEIASVAVEHLGVWRCYSGNMQAMESIEYTVELISRDPEYVESWHNETSEYVHLGCRIVNHGGTGVEHCGMAAPNGKTFHISTGMATERYLSLGTDLNRAVCSLKIAKPLEESETGWWRCEIQLTYRDPVGTYISVGRAQLPDYPKTLRISTQQGKSLQVSCSVPYSSVYCHIKEPSGIVHFGDIAADVTLGKCSVSIEAAHVNHNGTWTCSFAREIGVADEEIFVEVTIAEALSYARSIELDTGDDAVLNCNSGNRPLLYCRFISPTGQSYHVGNHENSSWISYHGQGLEYGDCGITVANVQRSDQGFWTCVTRLFTEQEEPEISAQILLNVTPYLMDDPGTNLAGIGIGIAVGVVVVSAVVGVLAMRKWRRRDHGEVGGTSRDRRATQNSDTSSNNSETILSGGPVPRSYTNPNPVSLEVEDDEHEHYL